MNASTIRRALWLSAWTVLLAMLGANHALALQGSVPAIRADPLSLANYTVGGNVVDGSGVSIALIDTEVKFAHPVTHPALDGRITAEVEFTPEGLGAGGGVQSTTYFDYAVGGGFAVWINDMHGTATAGVMVSTGLNEANAQTNNKGVAPGATVAVGKMWTSQLDKNGGNPADSYGINAALTMAGLGNRPIALIEDQSFAPTVADGTHNFTLALDYLAWQYGTLVVIPAGNAGPNNANFSIPADAFNGITVGATNAAYNQVANFSNAGPTDAPDPRRKPDVVAPGTGIMVPFSGFADNDGRDSNAAHNYFAAVAAGSPAAFLTGGGQFVSDVDPDFISVDGTSFAGPHVAGQAALLYQYGTAYGMSTANVVLRAVIVNSAEKIEGVLQMHRTITDRAGNNWLDSIAYVSEFQPLDDQMGAGQVDGLRSFIQYDAGQHGPGIIPLIGWDHHAMGSEGDFYDYYFDQMLVKNRFLSATLAWNRKVELIDDNNDGLFDINNDVFLAYDLDNLDLFLMLADEDDINNAIWSSRSLVDSLEHIFFQIPDDNWYKLRVLFTEDLAGDPSNYGLAWWTVVPEPTSAALLLLLVATTQARRRAA